MYLGKTFSDAPNGAGWDTIQPDGPPRISYPFKGDSVLSIADILIYDPGYNPVDFPGLGGYQLTPLGTFPNIQPWSANQTVIIIDQEFLVNFSDYQPFRLNSFYNPAWALDWRGTFFDNQPTELLGNCVLTDAGRLEDIGAGIARICLRWATIPPPRNEIEQYAATFPGYFTRLPFTETVASRVQYDYFLFDDYGVQPGLPLFPGGRRLDPTTGLFPTGLILPAQKFYRPETGAVASNSFLTGDELILSDGNAAATPPVLPSIPGAIDWIFYTVAGCEFIAEASTLTRWMGNIFERRTRFVLAQ